MIRTIHNLKNEITDLIENRVVNAMIIPIRFLTSDTKYRTNMGVVVSNGANRVQVMSAANEIVASLYSVSPNSSSWIFFLCIFSTFYILFGGGLLTLRCRPIRRWYNPNKVSPVQRSKRSVFRCFEDRTMYSLSGTLVSGPFSHAFHPGPRKADSLPSVLVSQCRSSFKSWLLGPSCFENSICCISALSSRDISKLSL